MWPSFTCAMVSGECFGLLGEKDQRISATSCLCCILYGTCEVLVVLCLKVEILSDLLLGRSQYPWLRFVRMLFSPTCPKIRCESFCGLSVLGALMFYPQYPHIPLLSLSTQCGLDHGGLSSAVSVAPPALCFCPQASAFLGPRDFTLYSCMQRLHQVDSWANIYWPLE